MHWLELDGLRIPVRVGGDPALDFCNTWAGWGEAVARDWLESYAHLAVWAGHAELLDTATVARLRALADAQPEEATRCLADARTLRTALHTAVLDTTDADAVEQVSEFVRRAGAVIRLRPGADPSWEIPDSGLATPVLAAAWAAGALLTSGRISTVGACPGAGCRWLFLDRRGRRRWCSMNSCGNRAKVRTHAARQRTS